MTPDDRKELEELMESHERRIVRLLHTTPTLQLADEFVKGRAAIRDFVERLSEKGEK